MIYEHLKNMKDFIMSTLFHSPTKNTPLLHVVHNLHKSYPPWCRRLLKIIRMMIMMMTTTTTMMLLLLMSMREVMLFTVQNR